jgi:hypothetical protein
MLVPMLLPMPPGIQHDDDEDHETQSDKHDHPGSVCPDLLDAIRKLGPIHRLGRYTVFSKK